MLDGGVYRDMVVCFDRAPEGYRPQAEPRMPPSMTIQVWDVNFTQKHDRLLFRLSVDDDAV